VGAVLLENVTVSYPLKNFHELHTVLSPLFSHDSAHVPYQDPEDSTSYHLRGGLQNNLFPSGFPDKVLYSIHLFIIFLIGSKNPAHFILHDVATGRAFYEILQRCV